MQAKITNLLKYYFSVRTPFVSEVYTSHLLLKAQTVDRNVFSIFKPIRKSLQACTCILCRRVQHNQNNFCANVNIISLIRNRLRLTCMFRITLIKLAVSLKWIPIKKYAQHTITKTLANRKALFHFDCN